MKSLKTLAILALAACAPPPLGGDTSLEVEPTPTGCGALDHRGACLGDTAVWCDNGTERRVDCALVDKRCGWVDDDQGFYCGGSGDAPPPGPIDGCAGVDGAGRCQGTSLVWCGGGVLRRLDCDAAGAVCAYLDAEQAYACLPTDRAPPPEEDAPIAAPAPPSEEEAPPPPGEERPPADPADPPPDPPADPSPPNDPCDGVDYLGECRGSTAAWCEDGTLQTRECGAQGCGWVNNTTGYYCGGVGDGPGGPPPEPPPGDPPLNEGDCGTPEEAETVRLANASRTQMGLPALTCDAAMIQAARAHSQDMCDNDYFDHTGRDGSQPWDRLRRAGAQFGSAGENIAWGYQGPQEVHTGWMNSPGHRANLLGNGWRRIGVGHVACGGNPYWTQVFAD